MSDQSVNVSASAELPDLVIDSVCKVQAGKTYKYRYVSVRNGGQLIFEEDHDPKSESDKKTTFWASTILIENGGAMLAGVPYTDIQGRAVNPESYGTHGGELTIVLWGKDQNQQLPALRPDGKGIPLPADTSVSVPCYGAADATHGPCGIPIGVWTGREPLADGSRFNAYTPISYDGRKDGEGRLGYFSYKSIGLAMGGTLQLRGYRGTHRQCRRQAGISGKQLGSSGCERESKCDRSARDSGANIQSDATANPMSASTAARIPSAALSRSRPRTATDTSTPPC